MRRREESNHERVGSALRNQFAGPRPIQQGSPALTHMKCPGIQHHNHAIDREQAGNQSEDAESPTLFPPGADTKTIAGRIQSPSSLFHIATAGAQPIGGPRAFEVHAVIVAVHRRVVGAVDMFWINRYQFKRAG